MDTTSDDPVQHTAALLIERFGADAAPKAYEVAEGFAQLGAVERKRLWTRIAEAIDALNRPVH